MLKSMTLNDEVLLQVKIVSDDLSGATLKELVELFITLFQLFLIILEFISQVTHLILSIALIPWQVWVFFWSEIAFILLESAWFLSA